MASVSDIIATQDADAIKRKRTSTQAMITVVRNSLEKILVKKVDGTFDHAKIQRVRAEAEHLKLQNYHQKFDQIHEAYIQYRELKEDSTEEDKQIEADEKHYCDVVDKIFDTLQLYVDYEESYKVYVGSQKVDSVTEEKVLSEKSTKDDLCLAQMTKKIVLEEAVGKLLTVKTKAVKMTEFSEGLSP